MTNLGLTGTSFRNLDANVERSTRRGKRPRRTADIEIAEGVWPNQEPLLLSARLFFFFWQNGAIFLFWPGFFAFLYQGLFSAFDFSIIVSVKSFHVGILSST